MPNQPKLTICVPSRNRQKYFQKTIEGMVRDPHPDLQFVFTDNSDDPSVMNTYMERYRDDPRIIYLPTTERILPMLQNWERTIHYATGEWVTFIGDDDHCETSVLQLVDKIQRCIPDVEAVSWQCLTYTWPIEGEPAGAVIVPLGMGLYQPTRQQLEERMFGWQMSTIVPTSGFSIYHSAVRRSLLDRISERSGGHFFEHPVVDYDMAMKVISNGNRFIYCERPFSVMGTCPESNSFSIGRVEDMKKKIADFGAELGRNFDEDPYLKDFPFRNELGLSVSIAIAQQWFKWRYKRPDFPGWERNFVEALARNIELFRDPEGFAMMRDANLSVLEKWKGGRFKKYFKPEFKEDKSVLGSGFTETGVYVRANVGGASNPYELFDIINGFLQSHEMIDDEQLRSFYKAPQASVRAQAPLKAGMRAGR